MSDINVKKEENLSLTLADLFGVLWRRLWIILIAAAIVGGSFFAYNYATYTEKYTSTTQLYVLSSDVMEGSSASTTAYYFQLALTIVDDCKELLVSDTVLSRAAEELGIDDAPSVLRGMIKIHNEEDSRILKLSVTTGDPELSCRIVNEVSRQGVLRINEIMKVNQLSIYEDGVVSRIPSNDVNWKIPAAMGILAGFLVYLLFLVLMLLDDKINDAEDVETYLGLTVLGNIPHEFGTTGKNRGGRSYGKYYGKYVGVSDGKNKAN